LDAQEIEGGRKVNFDRVFSISAQDGDSREKAYQQYKAAGTLDLDLAGEEGDDVFEPEVAQSLFDKTLEDGRRKMAKSKNPRYGKFDNRDNLKGYAAMIAQIKKASISRDDPEAIRARESVFKRATPDVMEGAFAYWANNSKFNTGSSPEINKFRGLVQPAIKELVSIMDDPDYMTKREAVFAKVQNQIPGLLAKESIGLGLAGLVEGGDITNSARMTRGYGGE